MPNALTDSLVVDDAAEDPEEPAEGAAPAGETAEPAAEAGKEPALGARTPINGRRAAAKARQDEVMGELKAVREALVKQGESYGEKLARIERENAELRGTVQGYISRPQQQEQQRRAEGPDPAELRRQARKALDAKDFDEYERLNEEATIARFRREQVASAPAQQQQAQVHPMMQMVASQYTDVVSNPAALEIASAHDRILNAQGVEAGPERWKKALDEGRRYLGGNQQQRQFSPKSRAVLSGVPRGTASVNGAGAGGREPGVALNAHEREWAKKSGMSYEEYAKHIADMHPERVEND